MAAIGSCGDDFVAGRGLGLHCRFRSKGVCGPGVTLYVECHMWAFIFLFFPGHFSKAEGQGFHEILR